MYIELNFFETNDENFSLHSLFICKHDSNNDKYVRKFFGLIQLIEVRI